MFFNYRNSSYSKITGNSFFDLIFDNGKQGEYYLYEELKILEKENYRFLFNLYIPKNNNQFSEIDMIIITTKGIIVLESKNYSGWIFGKENQFQWTQTLPGSYGTQKYHFYNPILQNKTHINYLKKILPSNIPFYSVIAFSNNCELKNITIYSSSIINYYDNILNEIKHKILDIKPDVITEEEVDSIYNQLYKYTQNSEYIKAQHISNINNKYKEHDNNEFSTYYDYEYKSKNNNIPLIVSVAIIIIFMVITFIGIGKIFENTQEIKPQIIEEKQTINIPPTPLKINIPNEIKTNQYTNVVQRKNNIKNNQTEVQIINTNETPIQYVPTKQELKQIKKQEK